MDKIDRAKLKNLIKNSDWEIIYKYKVWLIEQWNKGEVKVDDEFNTFWNLALREGKKQAMEEFINNLEKLALDDDQ